MKYLFLFIGLSICFSSCNESSVENKNSNENRIIGTWKLVYGEIREGDSIKIKDLSHTKFIKIINEDHFAFFNQIENEEEGFYGGGGSYSLKGEDYTEKLDYISWTTLRGQEFNFTIEFREDTLVQYGLEEVKEANIKRHIIEKYIKVND